MGLGISVFLSIYVTAAVMALTVAYLIWTQKLKSVALYSPGIQYLWALCALGIIAAIESNNNIGVLIVVALAGSFLIGAFVRSVMTRALFDKLAAALCAASLIAFMAGLIQYLSFDDTARICSVFTNANYYAAVTEFMALLAMYKLFRAEKTGQKGFYATVIAINAAGLYFSGCRTAIFVLFAAVSLMLLLYRRYKTLTAFWAFCLFIAALIAGLPDVFPRMSQLGSDMGTRLAIWHRAIAEIVKHPLFGEGALAFAGLHFTVDGMHIIHAHSIYLETVLCFGIAGVALILAYIQKNLSPIWQMRRSNQDRDTFVLMVGLLFSLALHGTVDATPFNVQTGLLFMLALASAGIQENLQPALMRLPVYRGAYLQSGEAGQNRRTIEAAKNNPAYTKKSA